MNVWLWPKIPKPVTVLNRNPILKNHPVTEMFPSLSKCGITHPITHIPTLLSNCYLNPATDRIYLQPWWFFVWWISCQDNGYLFHCFVDHAVREGRLLISWWAKHWHEAFADPSLCFLHVLSQILIKWVIYGSCKFELCVCMCICVCMHIYEYLFVHIHT